jgi:flagellar motility protein MotE (MotC chaperone)
VKRLMMIVSSILLVACQTVKPYGEKACTAMGFNPKPVEPASAEAASEPVSLHEDIIEPHAAKVAVIVRTKRKELVAKEADLDQREAALKAKEEAFATEREKFINERAEKRAEEVKEAKIRPGERTVQSTLALMAPKSAAKVIEAMDDPQAARIIMTLPPQTAADVFQALSPPRAARISAVLDQVPHPNGHPKRSSR